MVKYFYNTDYEDHIYDENGEKLEFYQLDFYRFHSDDEHKCIIPRNAQNGYMASKHEAYTIALGLIRFIKQFEQADIDEFNNEMDIKAKQEIEEEMKKLPQKKPKIKDRPGYVYFIQDSMGNTKIGLSKKLESRYKTYTEMPYDPELIHYLHCSDMVIVEAYFHKLFDEKRFKGEWFKLDEKDIQYIKSNKYDEEINGLILPTQKIAL